MERELFTWTGWDGEPETMVFYNPTLLVDIGIWKAGSIFATAIIRHHTDRPGGVLQLFWKGEEEDVLAAEFNLHYKVGEQIN